MADFYDVGIQKLVSDNISAWIFMEIMWKNDLLSEVMIFFNFIHLFLFNHQKVSTFWTTYTYEHTI
jgi:hypothetical protein